MPEKITGIDISERSVKAVSVSAGLKGYQIVDAVMVDIDDAGGVEGALAAVFQLEGFHGSDLVTALPLRQCSFRTVHLPFTDRKKIRQTLPFELEQSVPFPVDSAVVDYLTADASGGSGLLAGAVPRSVVDERMRLLSGLSGDIIAVDAGVTPVAAWLIAADGGEECAVLLDIGALQTECIILFEKRIAHIRTFPFGGDRVTETMTRALDIDPLEAEQKKRAGDIEGCREEVRALTKNFSRQVKETIQLLSFRGDLERPLSRVYVTGGGALFHPLREEIEGTLDVPVYDFDIAEKSAVQFKQSLERPWEPLLMNQALAMAIREARGSAGFNFLPEGADAGGAYEWVRRELTWAGSLAAVILLLLCANFYLDYRYDLQQLEEAKEEIRTVFTTTLPGVTRVVDPIQQMKNKIAEVRKAGGGRGTFSAEAMVLSLLRDMSRLVPESVDFLVTSLTYDEDGIRIKGETDNFNTVDSIKSALDKGRAFKSVTISSAKLMKTGGRVSFDLKMEPAK